MEGLHNLHSSHKTVRVITSWGMGWVGNVACVGNEKFKQNSG